jgi:phage terminase large subunit-like protein
VAARSERLKTQAKLAEAEAAKPQNPGSRPEGGSALATWKESEKKYVLSAFRHFVQANGRLSPYYYPPLHDRMCNAYEAMVPGMNTQQVQRRGLRMYPRGTFKTTLEAELLTWCVLKYPTILMQYVRATKELASDVLFETRNESMVTPFIQDIWGPIAPMLTKDSQYELSVGSNKDPTIRCAGLDEALNGTHCDFAVLDDLVNEKNYRSAALSRQVRSRLSNLRPMLHPKHGNVMMTGTYWPRATIYDQIVIDNGKLKKAQQEALQAGNMELAAQIFHKMWDIDIAGVHNSDGTLLFPGRIDENFLRLVREDSDEGQYYPGWYEMVPGGEQRRVFPKENRTWFMGSLYHDPIPHIETVKENGDTIEEVPVDVYMTLDPTLTAGANSDSVGMTIAGCDHADNWWLFASKGVVELPSAMVEIVAMYLRTFRPIKLGIEPGALSGEMVSDIRAIIIDEDLPTSIVDLKHLTKKGRRNKATRIESLEKRYSKGMIRLQVGPWCSQLADQMDGWPDLDHDDVLDSLSMMSQFAKPCAYEHMHQALGEEECPEEDDIMANWVVRPWDGIRVADGASQGFKDKVKEQQHLTTNMGVLHPPEKKGNMIGGHAGLSVPKSKGTQ